MDHAAVPVMWLCQTDGKMRRDGVRAALLRRNLAVDERARVHGAPGLSLVATLRGVDARVLSQQREEARMGEMTRTTRPIKRARLKHWRYFVLKSLSAHPGVGDSAGCAVAR